MTRLRRAAWLLIVAADGGLLLWGGMAALAPEHLLGPDFSPILAAGYESFTGGSWAALVASSPATAAFMLVLFRVYGAYGAAFAFVAILVAATAFRRGATWAWWALLIGNTVTFVSAMVYDRTVGAIGPFELLEYVGLALIYAALAVTAPFARPKRPVPGVPIDT